MQRFIEILRNEIVLILLSLGTAPYVYHWFSANHTEWYFIYSGIFASLAIDMVIITQASKRDKNIYTWLTIIASVLFVSLIMPDIYHSGYVAIQVLVALSNGVTSSSRREEELNGTSSQSSQREEELAQELSTSTLQYEELKGTSTQKYQELEGKYQELNNKYQELVSSTQRSTQNTGTSSSKKVLSDSEVRELYNAGHNITAIASQLKGKRADNLKRVRELVS